MNGALYVTLAVGVAASCALMSGCASIGAVAGAAAGVSTGAITSNPAIGIGVGITVRAVTDEAVGRMMKSLHGNQQMTIAATAGELPVGETKPWRVKHVLPIENGHGEVHVLREFDSALATCREFAFSVIDGEMPDAPAEWFLASICRDQNGWEWASAEPAVERWSGLQ
ncbi:hypothetical protein [Paraburkholderia sediminicola]|uniref:hypothetical protein n=1 Tax=Paraburkholderia sediminicola TaxID=458836 RepID=UPI0038BC8435